MHPECPCAARRAATLWGQDSLWLHVDADNEAARALYAAAGFALASEDGGWFGLPRRQLLRRELRPLRRAGSITMGPERAPAAVPVTGTVNSSPELSSAPGGGAAVRPCDTAAAPSDRSAATVAAPGNEVSPELAGAAPEAADGSGSGGSGKRTEATAPRGPGVVPSAAESQAHGVARQGGRTYVWDVGGRRNP